MRRHRRLRLVGSIDGGRQARACEQSKSSIKSTKRRKERERKRETNQFPCIKLTIRISFRDELEIAIASRLNASSPRLFI